PCAISEPPDSCGVTRHWNENLVNGMGDVSSVKERPSTTSANRILCVACLVDMTPVVPGANGPSSFTDWTSGFQVGHVEVSDQTRHTASGAAFVVTERSWVATVVPLFEIARRRHA